MVERTRNRTLFICAECSFESLQWNGQCTGCGAWNTLTEVHLHRGAQHAKRETASKVYRLADVPRKGAVRTTTGLDELDRVLGGGIVKGSVILLGGDPGIGKSTLALQCVAGLIDSVKVLYVTGEESIQQLALRGERLELEHLPLDLVAENALESILDRLEKSTYQMVIIDSIQSLYSNNLSSSPGSVSQVRETAEKLTRYAKQNDSTVLIIGHVTKEGNLAGPKILEHIVDTVLYFEGDPTSRYRLVRSFKNRFGSINEVGIFEMTERGLEEVSNPSSMFLSRGQTDIVGSAVFVSQEGSRPLLVEVQALVDESSLANPRRLCVGLDSQRLAMLLAALNRHAGISLSNRDVFVNIAGGIRLLESAADVAVGAAVLSSYLDRKLPVATACFGEIGLSGEIRPVQHGENRLREAEKLGFKRALVPEANKVSQGIREIEIVSLAQVQDLLAWLK